MKNRIQQFIEFKGISPGDLAAALDVQRSNISHILNGRNKPGAAFIEKFLLTYPDLNARWLLTGQGEMVGSGASEVVDNFESEKSPPEMVRKPNTKIIEKTSEVGNNNNRDKNKTGSEGVEKLVLLNSDGTFKIYNPGK